MTNINFDYHKFVDSKLASDGFKIVLIDRSYMNENLSSIKHFVNIIRNEFKKVYGWEEENDEYFLNPLVDKWKYSYDIINNSGIICMLSINSRYNECIHLHTVLVKKEYRNSGLSKYMLLKTAVTAYENDINKLELYCQKNNNGALILYLRMGFKIETIRNNMDILLTSDSLSTAELCYKSIS